MKSILNSIMLLITVTLLFGCFNTGKKLEEKKPGNEFAIKEFTFDTTINNKKVSLFVLKSNSMEVLFTNYGARIVGLNVQDKNRVKTDVVVGFNNIQSYISTKERYFGATIGRYGNRIKEGKFSLDNKDYQISINNGVNALHGGKEGFQNVIWDANQKNKNEIEFSYISKDMEEGFPGELKVKVRFSIKNDNELLIEYSATTNKKTVINLTNHAFFNLNGEGSGTILDHNLYINANAFTPVDSTLIPTGKIEGIKNSPFDFSTLKQIGKDIAEDNEQLKFGKGYDHNFVLNKSEKSALNYAAKVVGNKSGIVMEIYTTEPGLQFYSGNFMKSKNTFKNGALDGFRTAFCLETQHFPDSPNNLNFPSTVLNLGQKYESTSKYIFSVE
jgi:aldose 1-epimerase